MVMWWCGRILETWSGGRVVWRGSAMVEEFHGGKAEMTGQTLTRGVLEELTVRLFHLVLELSVNNILKQFEKSIKKKN